MADGLLTCKKWHTSVSCWQCACVFVFWWNRVISTMTEMSSWQNRETGYRFSEL